MSTSTPTPDPSGSSGLRAALSIGKQRRLSQIADAGGRLALVAVDQRGNLRRALAPDAPETVLPETLTEFKGQVIEHIGPHVTGALLDPEYGAAQVIGSGQLPGQCGLVVALEETGYEADAWDRRTALIDGFSPQKAVRMGASAAKLLLYFHPEASRAAEQLDIVADAAKACREAELPLIVEPLSFSINPDEPLTSEQRRKVVVETARALSLLDIDMLKLEFPVNSLVDEDRNNWMEACDEVGSVIDVPWLLLSAGVGFDLFAEQSKIACESGASGVLAGRAVWREATTLTGADRVTFLQTTACERMAKLRSIVASTARPFHEFFEPAPAMTQDWAGTY